MAYAVIGNIQAAIAQVTIDATSKPNTTQVEEFIDNISSEIDAVLSGIGVAIPVTAPASFLKALEMLATYGTAAMVLKSVFPESRGPGTDPAFAFWESRYQKGLANLAKGAGIPTTVSGSPESLLPSSYFTVNPDNEPNLGRQADDEFFQASKVF